MNMIKLHLGCGHRDFGPEWVHIDGGDYPHLNHKDICRLPFTDGEVDLIYASHVLEYFDREEVRKVLGEWYRVLKAGGTLRIAVPDFEAMANLYVAGKYELERFLGPMYGKMNMGEETIYHRTVYDQRSLSRLLLECGFKEPSLYEWQKLDHAHIDDHSQAYLPHMDKENGCLISLNISCCK